MTSNATTVSKYLESIEDPNQQAAVERLHHVILEHLEGPFEAMMNYGMIGYVVPHSVYPSGYHCNPKQPLPYIGLAAQKNSISLYHMGLYADTALLDWFVAEYPSHSKRKLDMGKSCIRFKKPDEIPYDLIAELIARMRVEQWIAIYEAVVKQ
jgi:Domain of unknown function (DU1801)